MNHIFIPLGDTCQPAHALRETGLRQKAYPFDWITGSTESLIKCLNSDFENFHRNLVFNSPHPELGTNTVLTDTLGFSFHHDYPTFENKTIFPNDDEQFIRESPIIDNWLDLYPVVYAKYQRRIERFRIAMFGPNQIICVCHRTMAECIEIHGVIKKLYCKDIIILTNSREHIEHPRILKYNHDQSDFSWFKTAVERALLL